MGISIKQSKWTRIYFQKVTAQDDRENFISTEKDRLSNKMEI
jgi:hypothetical protein